jgi:hypothetical protein
MEANFIRTEADQRNTQTSTTRASSTQLSALCLATTFFCQIMFGLYRMTEAGRKALAEYVKALKQLLGASIES